MRVRPPLSELGLLYKNKYNAHNTMHFKLQGSYYHPGKGRSIGFEPEGPGNQKVLGLIPNLILIFQLIPMT